MNRLEAIENWFVARGWQPWQFQKAAWQASLKGQSGLICVPTGSGKTYAAYLGPLAAIDHDLQGLQILYLTPLRSLTRDIERALRLPVTELNWQVSVESRTGDTATYRKTKQKKKMPHVLLTTPESLSLLQTDPEHRAFFKHLKYVIVDEWHELMGTKRGVLLELSLAHLKSFLPHLTVWGLSATLGNLNEAAKVLTKDPILIEADFERPIILDSILPSNVFKLPWAGYSGLSMQEQVIHQLDPSQSTLIFTNTRSQTERWYQALMTAKPEWEKILAIHHSSLDKKTRIEVEEGIKQGHLRIVVCTSSLDLGVDFPMVNQVIQIGSCKSLARLIQRAGRASHQPMQPCQIKIVPTHALEIVEILALREALNQNAIEKKEPLINCYDVLFQHLTTIAIGGGFKKEEMFSEIVSTHAFASFTFSQFEDVLNHLINGGSLEVYPDFHKLVEEHDLYTVKDRNIALRHRMNIGTINSDTHVQLQLLNGKPVGSIEEHFLASLKPRESFSFGGKTYELVQLNSLAATIRKSKSKEVRAPIWLGSKLPFSPSLAYYVRDRFHQFTLDKSPSSAEEQLFAEICHLQQRYSEVPQIGQCLIETARTKEGWHYFFYPFEGSSTHEVLATLLAYRLSRQLKATVYTATNDYGFELVSSKTLNINVEVIRQSFSSHHFLDDLRSSLNMNGLAKVQFRDIARIGGLVFPGYPTKRKTHRQLQMSSSLLFEIFLKYEPKHLLLQQAFDEVMHEHFHLQGLENVLNRLSRSELILTELKTLSPLALPLYASSLSGLISSESLKDRVLQLIHNWKS
ncbi:MAG: ligase-associated DNA damage response DEXH box helicase [Parachlamydiaceae bacterium]